MKILIKMLFFLSIPVTALANIDFTSQIYNEPREDVQYLDPNCREEDQGFRNNKQGRGWFWKQGECIPVKKDEKKDNPKMVEEKPKEEKTEEISKESLPSKDEYVVDKHGNKYKAIPKKQQIPWEILDQIDPREVADKVEPNARSVALMYPTQDNVYEYKLLKKWITEKATQLAYADIQVKQNNPNLIDINSPVTSIVKAREVYVDKLDRRTEVLKKYSKDMKIVMFYADTCKFCHTQMPILKALATEYQISLEFKNIKTDIVLASRLNVQQVPDMILVFNSPNGIKHQRIATGLTAQDHLTTALIRSLKYLGVEEIDEKIMYD